MISRATWRICCAFATLWLGTPWLTNAHPALVAIQECPTKGAHSACLPATFRLDEDLRDRIVERRRTTNGFVQSYRLTGRLDGGKRQTYRLDYVCDAPTGCKPNPVLSFLGTSFKNRSVVLTSRGAFEIYTKGFDADNATNLIIVDRPNQQVVARFVSYGFPTTLIKSKTGIQLWINRDNACVSAPRDRPELLKTSRTACQSQGMVQEALNVADNRALFEDLLKMREFEHFKVDQVAPDGTTLQADGGATATVSQLRGTNLLAIHFSCYDCEE
jgi:hypothetical protein